MSSCVIVPEIMHFIALALPLASLANFALVNKMCYTVITRNYYWRDRYRQDFPRDRNESLLQYSEDTCELFLHEHELDYALLYRVTYVLEPFWSHGRSYLREQLSRMALVIDSYQNVNYYSSAQEQHTARKVLVGEHQAELERYARGHAETKSFKIDMIPALHPLRWKRRVEGAVFPYCNPFSYHWIECQLTYYHCDDSLSVRIEHTQTKERYAPEGVLLPGIVERVRVPLKERSDISDYFENLMKVGLAPLERGTLPCLEDIETYIALLNLN